MTDAPQQDGSEPPGELPGVVGHYRPVRKIGEGATGNVYVAFDLNIPGREVALKILKTDRVCCDVEDLRREAAALAALQHANILTVHEIGESGDGPYLVTEYLRGESVAARLAHGPLPLDEALRIGRDVADGLRAAHDKHMIHRDVKPANLLLTGDGRVKLADFGLAMPLPKEVAETLASMESTHSLLTRPHSIAGTPGYMAPEVLRGEGATPAADQFALGVTLHEMVTGKHPFRGVTWPEMVFGTEPRIDHALPRNLARLIRRCLAPNPGDRYPAMGDVVAGLEAKIRARNPARRRMVGISIAAAVIVIALLVAWVGVSRVRKARAYSLNEAGVHAFRAGDFDEAYTLFVKSHATAPDFRPACNNLGMLSLSEGDVSRAVKVLEDCRNSFVGSAEVRAGLGRALREEGRLDEAETELAHALSLHPAVEQRPLILNELGLTLVENGKPEIAVLRIEESELPSAETLEGAILRKTLGVALLESDRPDEAVTVLRQGVEGPLQGASLGTALVALGSALEKTGDITGARKAFSRALLSASNPETEAQATAGLRRLSKARF